jgi:Putative Tad-like Flp pilus-assembly
MLGVIGAMAALSIDVVTLYTARSEAQLAADAGALAGARALANSGMTSAAAILISGAETLARSVATQAAANNQVGGRNLNGSVTAACASGNPTGQEICVSFNDGALSFRTDPQVTVRVQRTDLPTFFARIWGSTQLKVTATATAEAYNPSGETTAGKAPVTTTCVKPWLLPNIDPSNPPNPIFSDTTTGAVAPTATALLGWQSTGAPSSRLRVACAAGNCSTLQSPTYWKYYPGDPVTFAPPTAALPQCGISLTPYEESVAGCVPTPISCNQTATIDTSDYPTRNLETANAVNCLTHATNGKGDTVGTSPPSYPFDFIVGDDNPVALANPSLAGSSVMVSDSLVTVPVIASVTAVPPTNPVTIIGFVQLLLNYNGNSTPTTGGIQIGHVKTKVVNVIGCGSNATGQPILGNGSSPVAVRLITPLITP